MLLPFSSLEFYGFRSASDKGVLLEEIRSLNFLCGQNNSGKSNVLFFISILCNQIAHGGKYPLQKTDYHQGGSGQIRLKMQLNYEFMFVPDNVPVSAEIAAFLAQSRGQLEGMWFEYSLDNQAKATLLGGPLLDEAIRRIPDNGFWQRHWSQITKKGGGSVRQHWVPEILSAVHPLQFLKIEADTIPALRTIDPIQKQGLTIDAAKKRPTIHGRQYFGGMGITEQLFHNQHPPVGQERLRQDFLKVESFLRNVTGNSELTIEIHGEKDAVILNIDGKRLSLSSLGTGIEELVIISTAATGFHKQVVCIEEPELHIHPLLQRKLIAFLQAETDNIYFIATHSPHILDAADASVYHVQLKDRASQISHCNTGSSRFQICYDLGYHASDLLQANCIIWVEGPSDRVYLNSWIKQAAPSLIEGLDYSIMFYGGRLLSHLTAQDQMVSDFINLNNLNRNVAILIDSDKKESEGSINDTKKRIAEEVASVGGYIWITEGREIENYVDAESYKAALQDLNLSAPAKYKDAYCDRCIASGNKGRVEINKLRLAKAVMQHPMPLDVLNLNSQISGLVSFIGAASRKNI